MRILCLDGDGIGPEIMVATTMVVQRACAAHGVDVNFEKAAIGFDSLRGSGTTMPQAVIDHAKAVEGIILGPVSHNEYPPVADGGRNPSGDLRIKLDLFANIRPARCRAGFEPRCGKPIDLVIVRENTEGFYADRSMFQGPGEFMPTPDIALSIRKVTRHASLRIAEQAFALAGQRRRKVTAVHKANVLRTSDGLFLECVRSVAERYPHVQYEEQLVDSMAALLVRDSSVYDVIVTTNMFGDILSDQATEIAGGLGLAASLNAGTEHALAQAQHGSAPTLAGKDVANPSSLIGSAAMLLNWLADRRSDNRLRKAAAGIEKALDDTLALAHERTPDLGGKLGTMAFASRVADRIKP